MAWRSTQWRPFEECNSPGWPCPLSLSHGSAGAEAPGRRPQEPLPSRWCCRRASRLCARLVASAPRRCRETTWAGSPWHRGRHETWPKQPQSLLKRIYRFQADAAWEPRHLNLNGYGYSEVSKERANRPLLTRFPDSGEACKESTRGRLF